jgi:3-oxoadipate enol-lactonase
MSPIVPVAGRIPPSGDSSLTPLVLLHGLGMGAWIWRPVLPLLASHQPLSLTPDLPGFGSAAPAGPFSMEKAAQSVVDLVRAQNHGPAHIFGLSLGAMVALQVYQSTPEVVASLILSGGQAHAGRPSMILRQVVASLVPAQALTSDIVGQIQRDYPELLAEAQDFARGISKRSVESALRAVARSDFRSLLPKISVPTLVICGEQDQSFLAAAKQMEAAIPQARLQIIPGAGHVWHLDKPGLFAEVLSTFMEQVDAERAPS